MTSELTAGNVIFFLFKSTLGSLTSAIGLLSWYSRRGSRDRLSTGAGLLFASFKLFCALHRRRRSLAALAGMGGASPRSGDRLFELDLAGEAVTIAPDRQNRQLAAAMPVSHGAVLRLESAVYTDPIPLPGVADAEERRRWCGRYDGTVQGANTSHSRQNRHQQGVPVPADASGKCSRCRLCSALKVRRTG
jgi:hypothetical protein